MFAEVAAAEEAMMDHQGPFDGWPALQTLEVSDVAGWTLPKRDFGLWRRKPVREIRDRIAEEGTRRVTSNSSTKPDSHQFISTIPLHNPQLVYALTTL